MPCSLGRHKKTNSSLDIRAASRTLRQLFAISTISPISHLCQSSRPNPPSSKCLISIQPLLSMFPFPVRRSASSAAYVRSYMRTPRFNPINKENFLGLTIELCLARESLRLLYFSQAWFSSTAINLSGSASPHMNSCHLSLAVCKLGTYNRTNRKNDTRIRRFN